MMSHGERGTEPLRPHPRRARCEGKSTAMKRKICLVIGGLLLLYIPLSCYDRSTEPTMEETTKTAVVSAKTSEIEIIVTDENNILVNGEKTTLAGCA